MASIAKWEQRAREALKKGNRKEFESMAGLLGEDLARRLRKQYLKPKTVQPVVKEQPQAAAPVRKRRTTKSTTAPKTTTRRTTRRRTKPAVSEE